MICILLSSDVDVFEKILQVCFLVSFHVWMLKLNFYGQVNGD